ncbi:MAG: type II toxin-antitoxin system VapC family toxin [Clostridiales bacterium]|nr:type II toxin-antitoxin system VapC family toxin [Clostridiales bacterium]
MRKKTFILDACALIAFLKDEEGAEIVGNLISGAYRGEIDLFINRVNLMEVYYGFYRSRGKEYALRFLRTVGKWKINVYDFTDEVLIEAGRLKVSYRISLADSVVLGQAIVSGAVLLTADHHEFNIIEKQGLEGIEFCWIR